VVGTTVTLAAGANTVRLTATGASGGNIDWLGVTKGSVPTGFVQHASFGLAEIGESGPAYAYDYFAGTGTLVPAGGTVSAQVTSGTYWVVAPVGPSGIAFLGDAGKWVAHGDKRIAHPNDSGQVHATIAFAPGEGPVTLHGYAPRRPTVSASAGSVGAVGYDASTKLFSFTVSAQSAGHQAVVTIAP
jgi:hypothetical protein